MYLTLFFRIRQGAALGTVQTIQDFGVTSVEGKKDTGAPRQRCRLSGKPLRTGLCLADKLRRFTTRLADCRMRPPERLRGAASKVVMVQRKKVPTRHIRDVEEDMLRPGSRESDEIPRSVPFLRFCLTSR